MKDCGFVEMHFVAVHLKVENIVGLIAFVLLYVTSGRDLGFCVLN